MKTVIRSFDINRSSRNLRYADVGTYTNFLTLTNVNMYFYYVHLMNIVLILQHPHNFF